MGDATNMVLILAGELLKKAENLLIMGLHPSEVMKGYQLASEKALSELSSTSTSQSFTYHGPSSDKTGLSCSELPNPMTQASLSQAIKPAIASKQYGFEDTLSSLVAEASLLVMPPNPKMFNVDNVRVVKIMGGSLAASKVVQGMVFGREPEGALCFVLRACSSVSWIYKAMSRKLRRGRSPSSRTLSISPKRRQRALSSSKTPMICSTSLAARRNTWRRYAARPFIPISAIQLIAFQIFAEIAESGVKVIIAGTNIGELALHYLNRHHILVLKVLSKFELRRLCRVVSATPLARLGAPTPEEAGFVDICETIEVGGDRVTVLRQDDSTPLSGGEVKTKTATIVLRGATQNHLDDLERAVDDGVGVIKALLKDGRLVPGAGATELELAKRVDTYGAGLKGLAQHAVRRFASALEVIPRTLAENARGGAEGNEVVARLWAKHEKEGGEVYGVDVEVRSHHRIARADVHLCCLFRLKRMAHSRQWSTSIWTHSLRSLGRSSWPPRQRSLCSA